MEVEEALHRLRPQQAEGAPRLRREVVGVLGLPLQAGNVELGGIRGKEGRLSETMLFCIVCPFPSSQASLKARAKDINMRGFMSLGFSPTNQGRHGTDPWPTES